MDQREHALLVRFLKPLTPSSTFSGSGSDTVQIKHPYYLDDFFQNVLINFTPLIGLVEDYIMAPPWLHVG